MLALSYRSLMSACIGFANRNALSMNLPLRGPGLFAGQAFDVKARRAFYTRHHLGGGGPGSSAGGPDRLVRSLTVAVRGALNEPRP
jgi:hypothetical protein